MDRCKGAAHYHGINRPHCNGNQPCQACKDIYVRVRLERILHNDLCDDPIRIRQDAANALEVLGQ